MPEAARLLASVNRLLEREGLAPCDVIVPVDDDATANPNVAGFVGNECHYGIKVSVRHPRTLARQAGVANWFADHVPIPVPRHLAAAGTDDDLPLLITEWMPGEQLRLAVRGGCEQLAEDWGRCMACVHEADLPAQFIDPTHAEDDLATYCVAQVRAACNAVPELRAVTLRAFVVAHAPAGFAPRNVKADNDLRDFLCDLGAITAVLDWERVSRGFAERDWLVVYMRLWLFGETRLWPAFKSGYESAGGTIERTQGNDAYLLTRCAIARVHGQPTDALIDAVLGGSVLY